MKNNNLRKRISKIIDQLSKGETTSNLAEEIRKSFDKTSKKSSNKNRNTPLEKN